MAVPVELNCSRRDVLEVGAFFYEINERADRASRYSKLSPITERMQIIDCIQNDRGEGIEPPTPWSRTMGSRTENP